MNKQVKLCKDGRIYGQTNKWAGEHLGILTGRKKYIKKGGVKGTRNPMYGRHHSLETKEQMRVSSWKGGMPRKDSKIRQSVEAKLWCNAVFTRDDWTCQRCQGKNKKVTAHHIKSFTEYPELRFAIDNGETLCFECHKLTDNYGGGDKKL